MGLRGKLHHPGLGVLLCHGHTPQESPLLGGRGVTREEVVVVDTLGHTRRHQPPSTILPWTWTMRSKRDIYHPHFDWWSSYNTSSGLGLHQLFYWFHENHPWLVGHYQNREQNYQVGLLQYFLGDKVVSVHRMLRVLLLLLLRQVLPHPRVRFVCL